MGHGWKDDRNLKVAINEKGDNPMIPFLVGLVIGGSLGFLVCGLFVVARDDKMEKSKYIR